MKSPLEVYNMERFLAEAKKDPDKRDLDSVHRMVNACFDSNDYKEGRRAFMEKRKPDFAGE